MTRRSPTVDARYLSARDYRTRLRQLGIDASALNIEERLQPPEPEPHLDIEHARDSLESAEAAERRQRAEELNKGAIDGKTATPEQVRARLAALGLRDMAHSIAFTDPQPAEAPVKLEREMTPEELRQQRLQLAEAVVNGVIEEAKKRGIPVDARKFNPTELEVFMRLRGPRDPWSWTPC